jgi:two-component system response regulator (stage 0 sporulation protein F)
MKKILVVDDEADIRNFVCSFFKERGYAVLSASGGEEALPMVEAEKPDLILLDIKMKGMDGIAALKHIRDIDKKVKILMVTALEDQDRMDEACRLGASEYINKPLVLEHLEHAVENNLK